MQWDSLQVGETTVLQVMLTLMLCYALDVYKRQLQPYNYAVIIHSIEQTATVRIGKCRHGFKP